MKALRDFFVVPADAPPRPRPEHHATPAAGPRGRRRAAAPSVAPPVIGLVAERRDAPVLAATVALLAARRYRLRAAVAAVHDATAADAGRPRRTRVLSSPAARRLARSLHARELAAAAAGRLVMVALPTDPTAATQAAERTTAAAAGAATVIAAAGARDETIDALLARCDAVLVAVPRQRAALAELAASSLRSLGVTAVAATASPRPLDRAAVAVGLSPSPPLAAALGPALEAALAAPTALP